MLFIDCDLFHLLLFIGYFFKTAIQKYSPELCESHKKHQERTLSKVLSCEIWEIFQNSFLLEQLSPNVFVSGVGHAQLYQSKKYLIWVIKQITPLTNIQSYFYKLAFPKIKNRNILQ